MPTIEFVCKIEVLPNVWHHNVLVDGARARVIENTDTPMSPTDVVQGIRDGILATTDGWVRDCP